MADPHDGAGRVAIVVVSHSAGLAAAAVELATAMTPGRAPHVGIAAGTGDGGLGTDAVAVSEAIRAADDASDGAGVVVLMDLGSAVMSAEMALDLVEEPRGRIVLSPAPFVEGLLGAVVQAAQGSPLDRVLVEVDRAAGMKAAQLSS